MNRYGKMGIFVALLAALACGGDAPSAPQGSQWAQYNSARWTYRYEEPGYAEWLRGVSGTLVLSRAPTRDSVAIAASGPVQATFAYAAGADSGAVVATIWPSGFVYRAIVTPADSFSVVSSNAPDAWPGAGSYVQAGDSVTFTWDGAYASGHIFLQIVYRRLA